GRTRHYLGGDVARSARPVVNDEWLAETLGQPLTDQEREDVRRAARRKADDDAHRPRRIGLRLRDARHGWERGHASGQLQKMSTVGKSIALATLRLITSSNFDACSTGRSAGLVPLSTRAT